MEAYEDRRRASSFGDDAEQYDRARPSYPAEMIDDLLDDDISSVLDVGCGTGIAARLFAERGREVLGIEPDERMAELSRRSGIRVEIANFEAWDPSGRRFDLVSSGQAWHWVEPHQSARKAGDVLRSGGRVALFWNRPHHEADLEQALERHYSEIAPASVALAQSDDRVHAASAAFDATGRFAPVARRSYGWKQTYSRDEWLDCLETHSLHRVMDSEPLRALLNDVGELIDRRGGAICVEYETIVLQTRRE